MAIPIWAKWMYPPIALICMAAAIFNAVDIRLRWSKLNPEAQRVVTWTSLACLMLYALELVTHWHTSFRLVNELHQWLTLGCYALLALLVSRIWRNWFAAICSGMLFLLAPMACLFLTLGLLFRTEPQRREPIGNGFFVSKVHWDAGAMGSSGTNLLISYQPHYLFFLERDVNWVRFDDAKCNAEEAFLVVQPDRRHVLARCPWHSYEHKDGYHDFLVPLY